MSLTFVEDEMTTEVERDWLGKQAISRCRIVEVGCWKGNTTKYLAEYSPGKVFAVDVWRLCDGTAHLKELADIPLDYLFHRFMENVGVYISAGRVVPIPLPSLLAAKYFQPKSLDMVFIDADHHYEAVRDDILAWRPLVKDDGLLCGHDFLGHPGVEQAVKELVPDFKLGPGGSLWFA